MAGTKENKSKILKTWEGINFRLYVPKVIDKNNKVEVHFTYTSPSGEKKQVKSATGIDRYAKEATYTKQAFELVDALIRLLQQGYNFKTKSYPDHIKLHSKSTITECIYEWLKLRQQDVDDLKINIKEFEITTHLFDYFNAWLAKNHFNNQTPEYFTKNDINVFLRDTEIQRGWGKATYNSYNHRLNYFYKFLISERVTAWNPVTDSYRYKLANVATRFQIYEDVELSEVKEKLSVDKSFTDLYISIILLYNYRVRGAEQLRLKIKYFDFENSILTIPAQEMNAYGFFEDVLKNGEGARIELHREDLEIIKNYIGKNIDEPEFYLYSGHNKSGRKKCNDEFLSQKFDKFRLKYDLPKGLKWYAIKHTANYNTSDDLTLEQQRIINRHKRSTTTIGYKEAKVKKQLIRVDEKHRF